MKKILAFMLVALMGLATFKEATIYVFFKLNQNYIAKNLCVEREIESSTCKGCCQLKKQINENREQEQKTTNEEAYRSLVQLLFCIQSNKSDLTWEQIEKSEGLFHTTEELYSFQFSNDCFHPPKI